MAESGNRTNKSRRRRRIRRFKRRLIQLFLLAGIVMAVCVISKNIMKSKDDRNTVIADESMKLNNFGEGDVKKADVGFETMTASTEKLAEFKQLYGNEKNSSYIVCLDAGHGGDDVGAEGIDGSYEKNQTLELSRMVQEYLEAVEVQVVMTRTGDESVSLNQRKEIAENCHADLLLSIHRNVYEGTEEVNGIEAWINNSKPYDANLISENILNCIEENVSGVNNRGVKWGSMDNVNENYGVNKVSMASLILEVGFVTSSHDNQLFDKYLDEIAKGIAQGVLESISDLEAV